MEQKIESRLEEKVHLLVSKVSKYKHFVLAVDIFHCLVGDSSSQYE